MLASGRRRELSLAAACLCPQELVPLVLRGSSEASLVLVEARLERQRAEVAQGRAGYSKAPKRRRCGFRLVLTCYRSNSEEVKVVFTQHSGHDPCSSEDRARLRLAGPVLDRALDLLSLGKKPMFVAARIAQEVEQGQHLDLRRYPGLPSSRYQPSMPLLHALRNRALRANKLSGGDVQATARLLHSLPPDCLLLHQPQVLGASGEVAQHLVIVFTTPFMRLMAERHASHGVCLDGTFCTNLNNYPLYALLARDELGRGVPLLFCIASTEAAEPIEQMLQLAQHRLFGGTQPPIMVDKGSSETSALRALGWRHFLCYFHFLQVWKKWLKSSDSKVRWPRGAPATLASCAGPAGL